MNILEIDKKIENSPDLTGTSGNERLFLSGLMEEFECCKLNDLDKAEYILVKLGFESDDIIRILK